MKHLPLFISTATGALLLTAIVGAQPFPGGGPGFGMGQGFGMGPRSAAGAGLGPAVDIAAYAEVRLADFKARLAINTSQENAWQAFAAQFKQQAQQRQAMRAQMWADTASGPERMTSHAQFMQQRASDMAAMAVALKDLYVVLTPEQRTMADQLFARGPGSGGRFHWRG